MERLLICRTTNLPEQRLLMPSAQYRYYIAAIAIAIAP